MKIVALALLPAIASGYVAPKAFVSSRPTTQLQESFGFDFAEDTYKNQAAEIGGEAAYKTWINGVNDNAMLSRQYNALSRVRELDLLGATADAGLLSKLEANGIDLETIEELLPTIEKLGLLSLVGNNQQLLINGVAPLVVEGAPFLLPAIAGALATGPAAFYLGAAVCGGLEAALVATNAELPLIGLPAAGVLGLLLVPLTVVLAGAGTALASVKKN